MLNKDNFKMEMRLKGDPEIIEDELLDTLRKNGYFAVAEIDVRNIIMKNFSRDTGFLRILEVCKPKAALDLFTINKEAGLFLPCKVLISKEGEEAIIRVLIIPEILPNKLSAVNDTLEIYMNEIVQILKKWYSSR